MGEFQLINLERMKAIENHHLANTIGTRKHQIMQIEGHLIKTTHQHSLKVSREGKIKKLLPIAGD